MEVDDVFGVILIVMFAVLVCLATYGLALLAKAWPPFLNIYCFVAIIVFVRECLKQAK